MTRISKGHDEDKPPSLATLAYEQLHQDIATGHLAPGKKLRVAELHATYKIGLSPLRDALNRLCADGLVVKREQKGFVVADLDEEEFLQITNARLALEDAAIRLSIANGGQAWEEALVLAFYRLTKASEGDTQENFILTPEWSTSHQEFHFALISACENQWLLGFCKKLYEQTIRFRARRRLISASRPPIQRSLVQEHKDILDACLARDADRASLLLIKHYQLSFELVMDASFDLHTQPYRLAAKPERLEVGGEADKSEELGRRRSGSGRSPRVVAPRAASPKGSRKSSRNANNERNKS